MNGVTISSGRFVPPGASIDNQEKADLLNHVPSDQEAFTKEVPRVNEQFPSSYSLLLGIPVTPAGFVVMETKRMM
ncbi:hypothetical protein I5677_13610 [Mobilitalea sibirica]|uniref:Uncharacterized protein n=2 Tax=Mobilitalea sibirica TaxID=1462919 RepID=A0A8J7H0I8_9FIRM|nr:hypothetical protein [Mobilitalea sibirica]